MYARLIIGIVLILVAALGPYFGLSRAVVHRKIDATGQGQAVQGRVDHRTAAMVVLRIGAAVLGAILIVLSSAQLLQGHGKLGPQDTHPVAQ
jgi:hypothetical protein